MAICNGENPWALGNACVLDAWTTLAPAVFVVWMCIVSVPAPSQIRVTTRIFAGVFKTFLTLPEAEAYDRGESPLDEFSKENETSVWRMFTMSWIAIAQTVFWMGLGCYRLTSSDGNEGLWEVWGPVIIALSWLYAAVRPILRPTATPPYDLLMFYFLESISAVVRFASVFFKHDVYGDPLPNTLTLVTVCLNIVAILLLIIVVMSMPLAVPSQYVDKSQIVCILPTVDCLHLSSIEGPLDFTRGLYNPMGMGVIPLGSPAHSKGVVSLFTVMVPGLTIDIREPMRLSMSLTFGLSVLRYRLNPSS